MPIKLLSHSYIFPIRLALEIIWEPQLNLRIVKWLFALFEAVIIIYRLCFSELFTLVRKLGIPLNKNFFEVFLFSTYYINDEGISNWSLRFHKKDYNFFFANSSWCIALMILAMI